MSGHNAASGKVYLNAFCVHQIRRHSVDSPQEKHTRENAKEGDKLKTTQCVGTVNDISEPM